MKKTTSSALSQVALNPLILNGTFKTWITIKLPPWTQGIGTAKEKPMRQRQRTKRILKFMTMMMMMWAVTKLETKGKLRNEPKNLWYFKFFFTSQQQQAAKHHQQRRWWSLLCNHLWVWTKKKLSEDFFSFFQYFFLSFLSSSIFLPYLKTYHQLYGKNNEKIFAQVVAQLHGTS